MLGFPGQWVTCIVCSTQELRNTYLRSGVSILRHTLSEAVLVAIPTLTSINASVRCETGMKSQSIDPAGRKNHGGCMTRTLLFVGM